MEDKPGFGFRPYDEELVGYYLRHKIVGDTSLVEGVISEVNICSFDPWDLRFQSKIKSRDHFWYFFSRRENKYANGNRQSRRTPSGYWKLTGESVDVTDQWGDVCGIRGKIGHKRVLMFLRGKNSIDKDWVIHEFHYTLLPEDERTYVICRLEYKGNDVNILSANATNPTPTFGPNMTNSAGSVVNQSLQENSGSYNTYSEYDSANRGPLFSENLDMQQLAQGNSGYFNNFFEYYGSANQGHLFAGDVNMQQQAPYSAPYGDEPQMIWDHEIRENYEFLVDERTCMEEHYNEHRPKNPVTGVLADDSGDSDTDSMIDRDTWSSPGSVDSSNGPYHTPPIDDIPSLHTIEPFHNYEAQEPLKQLKLQLQGKEKVINKQKSECEWKMAEGSSKKAPPTNTVKQSWIVLEEINQRNSQWNYLKNMIIGFLLFISIIGWIILVG